MFAPPSFDVFLKNRLFDFAPVSVAGLRDLCDWTLMNRWKGFACYRAVYANAGLLFAPLDGGEYQVETDADYARVVIYLADTEAHFDTEQVTYKEILFYIFQQRLLRKDMLFIHSAAVSYRDEAVLFCGSSGIGKSTQAGLWYKFLGADMINMDKPFLFMREGRLCVSGSPWSGKERVFKDEQFPVKCMVFLSQGSTNRLRALHERDKYVHVYMNNTPFFVNEHDAVVYAEVAKQYAHESNAYALTCTPDERAVKTLFFELYNGIDYEIEKGNKQRMKTSKDYMLRSIAGEYILFPVGRKSLEKNMTVVFNETGAFLWNKLAQEANREELISALLTEYDVKKETAENDVDAFIRKCTENALLEE